MSRALRGEWEKIRRLWTPRVVVVAILAIVIGGALIARLVGADDPASAVSNATLGLEIAALFATAVFAVWMFGAESAQGLLARTFTGEPRRGRIVAAKLLLAVAVPAAALLVAAAVAAPLVAAAATDAGGSLTTSELVRGLAGKVVQGLAVAPAVFGLALLAGNLAGGIAAAFVLLEIVPGLLSVAGIDEYGLSRATEALFQNIAGDPARFSVAQALAVLAAWSVVSVAAGWARVGRADVA